MKQQFKIGGCISNDIVDEIPMEGHLDQEMKKRSHNDNVNLSNKTSEYRMNNTSKHLLDNTTEENNILQTIRPQMKHNRRMCRRATESDIDKMSTISEGSEEAEMTSEEKQVGSSSSSVYSPFSDRIGHPLHNMATSGVLMNSMEQSFYDRMPFLASATCVGCSIKQF